MAKLSHRYATALFSLYLENGAPADYFEQVVLLRDTLQDEQCRRIVLHPHISSEEKCAFFRDAFEWHVHKDLLGFLYLLARKNREQFLAPALTELIDMINKLDNKTTANVISATELSEQQISALKSMLSKKLSKEVELSLKVEPSVIGGLSIYVDGYFINRTVKRQLHEMKVSMEKEYGA